VNSTGHNANIASSSKTGPFATLRGLLHAKGIGASTRLILPVLATVLGALAFSATPSLAGEVHVYSHSFGEPGTEAGQFEDPSDLAVNTATGDVYVADKGNNRIDEFDSSGTFIQAWGWGVADGLPMFETCTLSCQAGIAGSGKGQLDEPEQLAVDNSGESVTEDPSAGDVYVTDRGDNVIDKFSASGKYEGELIGTCEKTEENSPCKGSKLNLFSALDGVAVDPRGLVWVDQSSGEIDSFSDAQANEFHSRSEPIQYPGNSYVGLNGGPAPGLSVDSKDDLYVTYSELGLVARLNSAQELVPGSGEGIPVFVAADKGLEVGISQPGRNNGLKKGIAVDFSNDNVYLDMNQNTINLEHTPVTDVEELSTDGSLTETFGSEQLSDRGGSGLAVNSSTGTVYVADDVAGAVFVYQTVPTPSVLTGAASDLHTEGAATLNGTVDPEGIALEECRFEYFSEKAFAENLKNEVQSVTVSAGATGGDFTLSFKGETTPPLPENAFAGEIRFYLETFASIGAGNVAVTGSAGAYTIEFKGALAHTNLPALAAESYAGQPLEPTGASVTAAIVTPGGDGYEVAATAPCVPTAGDVPTGSGAVPVTAAVSGLTPDTLYKYRLEARNHNGEAKSEYRTFVAPARPEIAGVALSGVGSSVATLSAQIDPGGAPTGYRVEYGTSEAYGSSTLEASAGAGSTPAAVQISLSGLLPGTVYHARIVASNEVAVVQGASLTFTTSGAAPASASILPDDRAYELVSNFPPGRDEETDVPSSGYQGTDPGLIAHGLATPYPFQVASNGDAVVYPGDAPPTGGSDALDRNDYMATRTAGGTWTQVNIQPPGAEYRAFSSDLSVGILSAKESELGGGSSEPADGDLFAHMTAGGAGGEYEPLYTGTPPNRPSSQFGTVKFHTARAEGGLYYAGANAGTSAVPASSQLLVEADDALLTGAGPFEQELDADVEQEVIERREGNYLYDSAAGRLSLVDLLPDGQVQPNASFGSYQVTGGDGAPIAPGVNNAISADGSRIFWTALEGEGEGERPSHALYVRENATQPQSPLGGPAGEECTVSTDACTVQVDASQGGPESGGGEFWTASGDGSRVLFTDCRRLTGESTAVPGGGCSHVGSEGGGQTTFTGNDLYEYQVNPETGKTGVLRDLTVSTPDEVTLDEAGGDLLGADVQGVLGASEDGEYVYFAADGVLTTGQNTEGREPIPGQPNLYLRHDGATTFIATLSTVDGSDVAPIADCGQGPGCAGDWQTAPSYRTAEVTPDGHSLVFMSNRSLTGYDSEDTGHGLDEVFLFEAGSGSHPPALRCVSCNPSGEPPVPTALGAANRPSSGIGDVGGFIPTSQGIVEQPRVISADGSRVFFDSGEPLVPTDTNGWLDVYEWERDGAGTCTDSQGCVYLLSGGTDPENSYLIGADSSGDNAFFVSRADLVLADRGGDGDELYDARVDGVQPPAVAACEGTGCQGVPPTPPIFATPASVTFNGIGNFPPPPPPAVVKPKTKTVKCRKPKKLTHGKCVKPKKTNKAKKSAHTNRRARR
jgi:hypothetical protein